MRAAMQHLRVHRKIVVAVVTCAMAAAARPILRLAVPLEITVMAASKSKRAAPNYDTDIAPILQKNCLGCHSSTTHKSGLIMESYSALIKGGKHGQVIVPHDAKGSRLFRMIEGDDDPQMPLEADPLPPREIALLKSWIEAGAEGPAPNEAAKPLIPLPTADIHPQKNEVSPVTSVKFSPDGSVLAVGGYGQLRLVDPASGKALITLAGHPDFVRSIAFSPDGKMVAGAGGHPQGEGEIRIWDVQSHQLLKTMQGHKDCIYSIAWSPDGKLIASGSYDKMVKLWDVASGKELLNLQDHIDAVFAVAFSPDGKLLASASQDRTVKIWNVANGHRLFTLSDALDGLTSIAFSSSGDQVAAAGYDKTIYIWSLTQEEGHLAQSLIADQDSLLAMVWSPDRKTIVTASSDGSIRFRDAATLEPVSVINKQTDWVETLDISPDGKWLAAGRYDGTLSLYDAKTYKELQGPMIVFDSHESSGEKQAKALAGK